MSRTDKSYEEILQYALVSAMNTSVLLRCTKYNSREFWQLLFTRRTSYNSAAKLRDL